MRPGLFLRAPFASFAAGIVAVACSGSPRGDESKFPDGRDPGATEDAGRPSGTTVVSGSEERDAGPLSADAGCAGVKSDGKRSPVYMLVVLDASASMEGINWNATTQALSQFFQQVQAAADPSFGLGLTIFEDAKKAQYGGNGAIQVPIKFVDAAQGAALAERLNTTPKGSTPTLETLTEAFRNLAGFAPTAPLLPQGKKVVVLISDGVPDGIGVEQTMVENLVRDQAKKTPAEFAIKTFSVGVGSFTGAPGGYDPRFMARVAVAGDTARANCDVNETANVSRMCHFQLTPGSNSTQLAQAFLAAINQIRGLAAPCEYSFTVPAGQTLDPSLVSVTFTQSGSSTEVPKNASSGWQYDNPTAPTKVLLVGDWCERVKSASESKIEVVIGCAPKVF